jgi:transcription initiation factor IIF auxiliary subunit
MGTKMTDLKFDNYSRFIGEKDGYRTYAWCVFMDVSKTVLSNIETVEYILHPTFPEPVRRINDREHCFVLQSEGWGDFVINIRVFFRDAQTMHSRYLLKLEEDNWPRGPKMEQFPNEQTKVIYSTLLDDRYEWRKMSTIIRRSGLPEEEIEHILQNLAKQGYARQAYYKSVDNQELWGATFIVRVLPQPAE